MARVIVYVAAALAVAAATPGGAAPSDTGGPGVTPIGVQAARS